MYKRINKFIALLILLTIHNDMNYLHFTYNMTYPFNTSINQSINQSVNKTVNKSVNKSVSPPISQCVCLQAGSIDVDSVKAQVSSLKMMIADEERKMKKYQVCCINKYEEIGKS